MSQQQMVPEPQSNGQGEDETYYPVQPYYWSTQPNTANAGGLPKDEPLSSYEEPGTQQEHQAQQPTTDTWQPQQQQAQPQQRYGSDADAYEYGYRSYTPPNILQSDAQSEQGRQGAPFWSQQQYQRNSPIGLAILVLFILIGVTLLSSVFWHGGFFFWFLFPFFFMGWGRMRRRRRYPRGPFPWMW